MNDLKDPELLVVEKVRLGERQVFPLPEEGGEKPEIAAALLRKLALRQPIQLKPGDTVGEVIPLTAAGIQIENARIHGQIDLDYFGAGDALGALTLVLKNCDLLGDRDREDPDKDDWKEGEAPPVPALTARGARFAHVSLENSRFARIDIGSALVASDLNICGVQPLEDGDYCWIQARGVEVSGSFRGDGARLKLTRRKEERINSDRPKNYALTLSDATIRGSIHFNAATAIGGVILKNSRVAGDVWMIGAAVEKGEAHAIVGDSLHVDGGIGLHDERSDDPGSKRTPKGRRTFACAGTLSLSFARVDGVLSILGGEIGDKDNIASPAIEAWHLAAGSLSIGHEDKSARLFGHMMLKHARINGNVHINVIARSAAQTLYMDRAVVGGSVAVLPGSEISNGLSLEHAEIGRDIDFSATCRAAADGRAIGASSITVRGHVKIAGEVSGQIDLEGATVDGDIRLGAIDQVPEPRPLLFAAVSDKPHGVNLANARIARSLRFDGVAVNRADFTMARATPLTFYKGWSLVEAYFPGQKPKLACYLVRDQSPKAASAGPDVRALNGTSPPIYEHNARNGLLLETEEQVLSYLRFFCAHVWGPEGPFKIVESAAELLPAQRGKFNDSGKLSATLEDGEWRLNGTVSYGPAAFAARFRIEKQGESEFLGRIHMLDDELLGSIEQRHVLFQPPYRMAIRPGFGPWPLSPPHSGNWKPATPEQVALLNAHLTRNTDSQRSVGSRDAEKKTPAGGIKKNANSREDVSPRRTPELIFDVRGAQIGLLDDDLGRAWPNEAEIKLGGLHYDRLSETDGRIGSIRDPKAAFNAPLTRKSELGRFGDNRTGTLTTRTAPSPSPPSTRGRRQNPRTERKLSKARWQARQDWLLLQYKKKEEPRYRQGDNPYNPQPYEKLIHALHAMGDGLSARKITITKLNLERKLREESFFPELWRRMFVPFRWLYWQLFDYGLSPEKALGTFVILWLAGALATQVALTGWTVSWDPLLFFPQGADPVLAVVNEGVVTHRPCRGNINAIWYALDSFVPLIDLKQESRCDIRPERWGWVAAKSWYALLGWLVTSLAALTVSGLLRRYAER